jgi:putative transposase
MPRRLRDFVPDFAYHLTQRGNRKATVFLDDTDRAVYMKLLVENCAAEKVRIWAYSLMDNHILCGAPHKTCNAEFIFMRSK